MLQVGSGSDEKSTGSGRPKINGSNRIRILIPVIDCNYTNKSYIRYKTLLLPVDGRDERRLYPHPYDVHSEEVLKEITKITTSNLHALYMVNLISSMIYIRIAVIIKFFVCIKSLIII